MRPRRRGGLPSLLFLAAAGLGVALLVLGSLGAGTGEPARAAGDPGPPPAAAEPDGPLDEQVLALAFTPDGKRLVTAGGRHVRPGQLLVWDVAAGKVVAGVRGIPGIRGVAMSPDGQTVACGAFGGALTLRDVATGRARALAVGHEMGVNSVAYSRDGTTLVTAGLDRVLKLWDASELKEPKAFHGHTDMIFSVAFFAHGRAFVSGGQDRVGRVWDVATGAETLRLRGHAAPIETVAISPDDQVIATASWDRTVKFWDPATGQERATLGGHDGGVLGMAFSPDGKLLASGTDRGTVYLWDVEKRAPVRTCQEHGGAPAWSVAFSPDGKWLAVSGGDSDKAARLWDLEGGRVGMTLSAAGAAAGLPVEVSATLTAPIRPVKNGWFTAGGIVVLLVALSGFAASSLLRGRQLTEVPEVK